jgi:hypothetical protein
MEQGRRRGKEGEERGKGGAVRFHGEGSSTHRPNPLPTRSDRSSAAFPAMKNAANTVNMRLSFMVSA